MIKSFILNNFYNDNQLIIKIKEEPDIIKYINNPSFIMQLAAVMIDPKTIKYIVDPSSSVQIAALRAGDWCYKYITEISDEAQIYMLNNSSYPDSKILNYSKTYLKLAKLKRALNKIECAEDAKRNIKNSLNNENIKLLSSISQDFQRHQITGLMRVQGGWGQALTGRIF